jgi:2'-hydroxyisoflavone reductase
VLGGTAFAGRHLAEAALARGHTLTLFHRGRTGADLFPGVEHVLGDRAGSLDALRGRTWDAVVDTCGFTAPAVRASAKALADAVGRYLFVSTINVYRDFARTGMDEDAPLDEPNGSDADWRGPRYGPLKVACEQVVRGVFGERALIARPAILVGPHDYTGRFAWWARRMQAGGEVLAPGDPARPVQLIDARDLGDWMLRGVEDGLSGTFNIVGPERPLTFGEMLEGVRDALGSDARLTWVDDAFVHEHDVFLPFWGEPGPGFFTLDSRRAIAAGLAFRPLATTTRDTAADDGEAYADREPPITPEREAALLREWHARKGG